MAEQAPGKAKVVVTRPAADSRDLAANLEARGFEVLAEPLLTIAPLPGAAVRLDLDDVQALLFTSANGVRAFAGLSPRRDILAFAVGGATARMAREAGFPSVLAAGGDVIALAELVKTELDPARGPLLHPAARQVAGDLKGELEAAGFVLRREIVYEAQTADSFSPIFSASLEKREVRYILFYSPRTARIFVHLIGGRKSAKCLAGVRAICLSRAVATELQDLPWSGISVAKAPNQDALLALLEAMAGGDDD